MMHYLFWMDLWKGKNSNAYFTATWVFLPISPKIKCKALTTGITRKPNMFRNMKKSNLVIYWLLSFMLSTCAIGVIAYEWSKTQRIQGYETNVVMNKSDLEKVLEKRDTIEFQDGQKPYCIPTGFFIQSLAFITPSDVNITGYIWQKYPIDFPKDIKKGFIFAEVVNSGNSILKETYKQRVEQKNHRYDLIGWHFDVTLRQSFDYSNYPLDFLTVWLRLWQADSFTNINVMLVPDFDAYPETIEKTFGLDVDIVQGEWEIDETFFSYENIPYDTDFGFPHEVKVNNCKELFVNLGLRREFINAFIINLVPLFVVSLLLFSQVMTVSGEREQAEKFGFNTSGVIATCSALFFVVLLAHIQVRQMFAGSGLVYLEYFYLIMYAIILLTALNAYIFSLRESRYFKLIHYRNNFVPKVAYWPVVLWMMAIATWIKL